MKKKNNIIDNIKTAWVDFKDWFDYVKDSKKHMEKETSNEDTIKGLNETIDTLKKNLEQERTIGKEKDNLIQILDNRTKTLNIELCNFKSAYYNSQNEKAEVQLKLEEKEHQRRVNASAIGGLKKQINKLEISLERANLKINWLQNNQKAPSKEEILAYETRMKEVEKRLKEQK